ncbi:calcium-binding and coiled-coil domain-containing protein 2-like isoform X1 [Melanotaenia boesemani]|uniref:calcium-binding and coiled-coil domain-containing protein 2-like isoform X1 n=1 Tax=Melanotaenia boesemani TaxID=1250792 RepID=UPI001C05E848|nr:calcium-binding and coiled-coil domain-containing protein 2-like isoform X1 [Melanotaenia boesemani]XP_041846801.1 calcium-binding and coiled-coil domain-containing protein 2-like isoform X1 [Melanotaenia boesemani]XP_041846802.1 calcium-binding and coiled-coil domain-containing protein 2-like isoform X1 [Melanotaenia boesemani]XP_041846803.1 calcium-binding and coiled-coil domain-containing protein 2-like isoform X1 [Melanotaenia boesemani]
MDATVDNISPKEMLEKIAELDYSQCQLRDLNAEMRHWLDIADDDIATLRSENTTLQKQVKALEKILSDAQQNEAEACRPFMADDLDANKCSQQKIHESEKESIMMKELNKKLTAELKNLEQERDQDKITLSKLKTALQTLKMEMEEVQLALRHSDEVIDQKNQQLKHLEETVEEFSDVIKDLRLTKQELMNQLEDRQDEASFAFQTELMTEKERLISPRLSLAEEIQLVALSSEVKTSMTDVKHEESQTEELLEHHSLTVDMKTKRGRSAGTLKTAVQRAGLFVLCIFSLFVLAYVAVGCCAGNFDLFSNILWSSARLMLQPCFSVHYRALPPF